MVAYLIRRAEENTSMAIMLPKEPILIEDEITREIKVAFFNKCKKTSSNPGSLNHGAKGLSDYKF